MTEHIILFTCLVIGLYFMAIAIRSFRKRRNLLCCMSAGVGASFIIFTVLLASFVLDQSTYQRLTKEHTIAIIEFNALGNHHYRATYTESHGLPVQLDIHGDQWQIDARVMNWKGIPDWMGLKPVYRLERLTGRYNSIELENSAKHTAHSLDNPNKKLNSAWDYLIKYQEHIPWLQSQYGSATYMPMQNGARYMINISRTGLLAKPRNKAANLAVKHWF